MNNYINSDNIDLQKHALRIDYKSKRYNAHQNNHKIFKKNILNQLFNIKKLNKNDKIALYLPIQNECDTMPIVDYCWQNDIVVVLPEIIRDNYPLQFIEWQKDVMLVDHNFKTKIPASGNVIIPNIIIVPLLAFNENRYRLGYGGGFYDRTISMLKLSHHNFITIGLAYQGQLCNELIIDIYDEALDYIITEKKIY